MDPIGTELMDAATGGVSKSLRVKLAKSVLRLIAGGPGYKYLDELRHNENTIEGRKKIDSIVAEEVARQAIADPDYMERAKARFLGDMFAKQENVEAVARKAQEAILELTDDDILSDDEEGPTQDWMNYFTREAEMASSDDLRERLGKVLAGETRKPGSYSRATVRAVAEMEAETLNYFREFLKTRVDDLILKGAKWEEGAQFVKGSILLSDGLISGSSFTNLTVDLGAAGQGHIADNNFGIIILGKSKTKLQVPVFILTRIGKEIANLLEVKVDPKKIGTVTADWNKTDITKIFGGKPKQTVNGFEVPESHVYFVGTGTE